MRPNTSETAGLGHFYRSLRLAEELQLHNFNVLFVVETRLNPIVKSELEKKKIKTVRFNTRDNIINDAREFHSLIKRIGLPFEWLITDHYLLTRKWESMVKSKVKYILAFEDRVNVKHDSNIIVNTSAKYEVPNNMPAFSSNLRQLLGSRYYIADRDLIKKSAKVKVSSTVRQIVFFLGGSADPNIYTRILKEIIKLAVVHNMKLVAIAPSTVKQLKTPTNNRNVKIVYDYSLLPAVFSKSDLYIGSGGSITWDRLLFQIPGIVFSMANNQVPLCTELAKQGTHIYLGPAKAVSIRKIKHSLFYLLKNDHFRKMKDRCKGIVDAFGAKRIAVNMMNYPITIRRANKGDEGIILTWRNHPTTRQNSISSKAISKIEHSAWFSTAVKSNNYEILIAESNHKALGVIRYEDVQEKSASVSIYLNPELIGMGLGAEILNKGTFWIKEKRKAVNSITAVIKPHNISSIQTFLRCGYKPHKSMYYILDLQ